MRKTEVKIITLKNAGPRGVDLFVIQSVRTNRHMAKDERLTEETAEGDGTAKFEFFIDVEDLARRKRWTVVR